MDIDESDDEDWEEVPSASKAPLEEEKTIEITAKRGEIQIPSLFAVKKKGGISKADRVKRESLHRLNLLCLCMEVVDKNQLCNQLAFQMFSVSFINRNELFMNSDLNLSKIDDFSKSWFEDTEEAFPSEKFRELFKPLRHCDTGNIKLLVLLATIRSYGLQASLIAFIKPIPLSFSKKYSNLSGRKLHLSIQLQDNSGGHKYITYSGCSESFGGMEELGQGYCIGCDDVGRVAEMASLSQRKKGTADNLKLDEDGQQWFKNALWLCSQTSSKPKYLQDQSEDTAMREKEKQEMPSNKAGFKNHTLFALESLLRQNQIIYPKGQTYSVGNFKGELIYPRSHVHQVALVKDGEEPVGQRAFKRKLRNSESFDIDFDIAENQNRGSVPLYGQWQTEMVTPKELSADGKIPKNKFGDFDLFTANMLPKGAAHITFVDCDRVAKQLSIDFAKAVVGFAFNGGATRPIYDGIVVSSTVVDVLTDAAKHAEEKTEKSRVFQNWRRVIEKLLTLSTLKKKYAIK
ncbi:Rad4 beta-hairpin domain 3-domain-containing protein [Chytridium lagenaria]|nr:Rad4 beta-hairpin domain 3-domain-containing protein [Chytridium lagenaria]